MLFLLILRIQQPCTKVRIVLRIVLFCISGSIASDAYLSWRTELTTCQPPKIDRHPHSDPIAPPLLLSATPSTVHIVSRKNNNKKTLIQFKHSQSTVVYWTTRPDVINAAETNHLPSNNDLFYL